MSPFAIKFNSYSMIEIIQSQAKDGRVPNVPVQNPKQQHSLMSSPRKDDLNNSED